MSFKPLFELYWTSEAATVFSHLKSDASRQKQYQAVRKALQFLASNPRHNSLQTHEFTSLQCPNGEKVFEAYAEQNTPAAYRIFWFYGPERGMITVVTIVSHP